MVERGAIFQAVGQGRSLNGSVDESVTLGPINNQALIHVAIVALNTLAATFLMEWQLNLPVSAVG